MTQKQSQSETQGLGAEQGIKCNLDLLILGQHDLRFGVTAAFTLFSLTLIIQMLPLMCPATLAYTLYRYYIKLINTFNIINHLPSIIYNNNVDFRSF